MRKHGAAGLLGAVLLAVLAVGWSATPTAHAADLATALLAAHDLPPGWAVGGPLAPNGGWPQPCPDAPPLPMQPVARTGHF